MNNKFKSVLGIVLAMVMVFSLLVFTGCEKKPSKETLKASLDTMLSDTITQYKEVIDVVDTDDISTDISLKLDLEGTEEMASTIEMLEKFEITAGIESKSANDYKLGGLKLAYDGNDPLEAVIVVNDDNSIGFTVPALDENYYSISGEKIAEELGADMDVSVNPDKLKELADALDVVSKDLSNVLFEIVTDENLTIEAKKELQLINGEKTVTADLYTFKPTQSDLTTLVTNVDSYIRTNENFKKLFTLVHEISGNETELETAWQDFLTELTDTETEINEGIANTQFTFTAAMLKSKLIMANVNMIDGTDTVVISCENVSEGNDGRFLLKLDGTDVENDSNYSFVIDGTTHTEGTKKNGEAKIMISGVEEEDVTATITYDCDTSKKSGLGIPYGTYGMVYDDMIINAEVKAGTTGSDHILSVNVNDPSLGLTKIGVTLNSSDAPTTFVKPDKTPVDISNYTEEQISEIFDGMQARLMELPWVMELLMSMM